MACILHRWGLVSKPDTDDLRETQSRTFIAGFIGLLARVTTHDCVVLHEARHVFARAFRSPDLGPRL
jgi:UDP-glucose 6-dehydrogenase